MPFSALTCLFSAGRTSAAPLVTQAQEAGVPAGQLELCMAVLQIQSNRYYGNQRKNHSNHAAA